MTINLNSLILWDSSYFRYTTLFVAVSVPELVEGSPFALRMNLGNVTVLRFDVAWRSDFHTGFEKPDYDVFFSWDF